MFKCAAPDAQPAAILKDLPCSRTAEPTQMLDEGNAFPAEQLHIPAVKTLCNKQPGFTQRLPLVTLEPKSFINSEVIYSTSTQYIANLISSKLPAKNLESLFSQNGNILNINNVVIKTLFMYKYLV